MRVSSAHAGKHALALLFWARAHLVVLGPRRSKVMPNRRITGPRSSADVRTTIVRSCRGARSFVCERGALARLAFNVHCLQRTRSGGINHMFHRRPHHLLAARIGVFGTIAAAAGFVACSSPGTQGPVVGSVNNPALVTLDVRNAADQHVGSCTGTLLSPAVVLTAGHCVIASGSVIVTTSDAQSAIGVQFWSTWQNFQSSWSHPLHSDVAVILLDREIFVSSYPSLADSVLQDGQTVGRVRRVDATSVSPGNYEQVTEAVHLGAAMGFPLAYTMDPANFEGPTDTGGPLIDPSTNILYGVVSSRGATTGEVYVSRVEYLASWIGAIAQCTPPPIQDQCHPVPPSCDGGESSSGGSGGSGSGSGGNGSSSGGSGGGSGGSSGGSSSGGWGSSSGVGSSSGSGGSSSGGGGGSDGGVCNPPPPPPPPPTTTDDSGSGDDGGGGDDGGCSHGGSSGSGGSSGGTGSGSGGVFGGSSGGTASSSGSSSGSTLPGPGEPLVPDGPGCYYDDCGGCVDDSSCQDGQQDYGDCGCEPGAPYEAGPTQ
jgi:hypothetical protein